MFVVCGESLIDLVPVKGRPDDALIMQAHAGGSPYNCAMALARLGEETGFLCPISQDGFGDYLLKPHNAAGVVQLYPERVAQPTTMAVVTLDDDHNARYEFYRAADRAFTRKKLIAALPDGIELLQVGGFCSIVPEDAEVWLDVIDKAAGLGALVSIDPNVRPSLVDDLDAYKARLELFLDRAHIIKCSEEDLEVLHPGWSIESHVIAMLDRPHCELVVVTRGDDGSRAFTREAEGQAGLYTPSVFGDTVGAGDSLMAGLLAALHERHELWPGALAALNAAELNALLEFAAIVAGLNCAEHGCNPPTRAEVDDVIFELR
jgi:fructokinase